MRVVNQGDKQQHRNVSPADMNDDGTMRWTVEHLGARHGVQDHRHEVLYHAFDCDMVALHGH